jgi:hypothetical protein
VETADDREGMENMTKLISVFKLYISAHVSFCQNIIFGRVTGRNIRIRIASFKSRILVQELDAAIIRNNTIR